MSPRRRTTASWAATPQLLSPQLADLAGVRAGQRVLDVGLWTRRAHGGAGHAAGTRRRGRRRPVRAIRRGRSSATPRRRGAAGLRGAPAVPGPRPSMPPSPSSSSTSWRIRSRVWPRWRGSPGGTASLPRASGITPASTVRSACSGRRRAGSTRTSTTNRSSRARARATWRSSSRRPGCARSRRPCCRPAWSIRASRSGGSRTPLGVGPAGAYVASLDTDRRLELRERCRALLPAAPFVLTARAWAARGLA